jgi:chemotaxis protein methyltransferase CheR
VNDTHCIAFLQWALPRLGMRWAGFRKVRRQVCNRARRRARELGLSDLTAYRAYLETHPEEWAVLDQLTPITISRFHRDRGVFEHLAREVLPTLAARAINRGSDRLEIWSAGCASGEEPYTLAILWEAELTHRFPSLPIRILATDTDAAMLARAHRACYPASSLRELPERWRTAAFAQRDELCCLHARYKQAVTVASHDIRTGPPDGPFEMIMCRNLVFTYFDAQHQLTVGAVLTDCLRPGGVLVLGAHEQLPEDLRCLEPLSAAHGVYRRLPTPDSGRCRG